MFVQRRLHLVLVAIILVCNVGCSGGDPATRIERAREHQANAEYRAAIIELKNVLRQDAANSQARALLGEVSFQNGDSTTAIKELRRVMEMGAAADLYAVALARALLRESRPEEVVKLDPDAVTNAGKRAALMALIGMGHLQLENQTAAQSSFSAALALEPAQPDAVIGNARLTASRGDLAAAEASLQQMLQTNPGKTEGFATLAGIQQDLGEFASAEENFNKALKSIEGTGFAAERMRYLSGLMEALLSQNKTEKAQQIGSRMVEISAQHPLALFEAGRADYAAGNYDAAMDKAERVIAVHPTSEPPRMLMAAAALARGDKAVAATHLQVVVESDSANEQARKVLARVRMDMGDPGEALALLEPMMAAGSNDAELLAIAGAANISSGNEDIGLELLEQGIQVGGEDPDLIMQAAGDFLAAGEIDRAIDVLEKLPEAERVGQGELLTILAWLKKGDTETARAKAESIVSRRPESDAAHSLLGGFHLAVGELDQARSEFEKTLELNPGNMSAVVNLSRIDVAQGKPDQAKARFRAVLDNNPGNLTALTALAQMAENSGDSQAGAELLEEALSANPDALGPRLSLARYYMSIGNLRLAEERANQAVRAAPSSPEAHILLGAVLAQRGSASESIGHFENAIELAPNSAQAHYFLGRALAETGRIDASYDAYQRAVDSGDDFFPARAALVIAAVDRGDLNLALSTAESLVADYPERSKPLALLAAVQKARGDREAALKSYQMAAAIQPSSQIAVAVSQLRQSMGVAQPWTELEQWVSANPDDTVARSALAAAFKDAGLYDRAISQLQPLMAAGPDADVAMLLAENYGFAGDPETAAQWMRKAVDLEPASTPARTTLASLELQLGNTDAAMKLIRALRRDDPGARDLDVLEGDALMASGNIEAGIEAYDRALASQPSALVALKRYKAGKDAGDQDAWRVLHNWLADHPDDINVRLQLAQAYAARKSRDEAVDAYSKVLEIDPDNVMALNNISWVYVERGNSGDLQRGLAAASKAYAKQPRLVAIADTYGWMLLQDGQTRRAVEILGEAASRAGDIPEIHYHHAVALDAVGRQADAVAVLDRLLAGNESFEGREDAEGLRRRLSP